MPRFFAPLTTDHPTFDVAYALAVEAPVMEPDPKFPPLWLDAFIVPELTGCSISESLAKEYDPAVKEGDVLFLTLIQEEPESGAIHRYLLGMPVHFSGRKQQKTIEISVMHLLGMFEVEQVLPNDHESAGAKRLELTLRRCVRYTPDDPTDTEFATS